MHDHIILELAMALAATIATQGAGTPLGGSLAGSLSATGAMATAISGMTAATFTALCSKAALAVLNHQGDISRAAKSLLTKETLKSRGVDAAIIGLTGVGAKPSGFVGHYHETS